MADPNDASTLPEGEPPEHGSNDRKPQPPEDPMATLADLGEEDESGETMSTLAEPGAGETMSTLAEVGGDEMATIGEAAGAETQEESAGGDAYDSGDLFPSGTARGPRSTRAETGVGAEGTREARIGDLIGDKYEVVGLLGRGGYGTVFKAIDKRLKTFVAIKLLNHSSILDPERLADFIEEAKKITRLDHPNIVGWKALDRRQDGTFYFVMEHIDGDTLDKVIRNAPEHRLEPDRVIRLVYEILEALVAAHHLSETESILHLDLKPNNIFVVKPRRGEQWERVKVIDFGIGQVISASKEDSSPVVEELHRDASQPASKRLRFGGGGEGQSIGLSQEALGKPRPRNASTEVERQASACTPEYASPEQCAHVLDEENLIPLDMRSDLYSLGIMAYQMLTGRFPFDVPEYREDWLDVHRFEQPRPLAKCKDVKVPRPFAAFVDRLISKDPAERFSSTQEAHAALHRYLNPPAWYLAAKVAGAVALVASVAILYFALFGGQPELVTAKQWMPDGAHARFSTYYLGPGQSTARVHLEDAVGRVFVPEDFDGLRADPAPVDAAGLLVLDFADLGAERRDIDLRLVDTADERATEFNVVWVGSEWGIEEAELPGLGGRRAFAASVDLPLRVQQKGEDLLAPTAHWIPAAPPEGEAGAMVWDEQWRRVPGSATELIALPGSDETERRFSTDGARGWGWFELTARSRSGELRRSSYPAEDQPPLMAFAGPPSPALALTGDGRELGDRPSIHVQDLEAPNASGIALEVSCAERSGRNLVVLYDVEVVDRASGTALWGMDNVDDDAADGSSRRRLDVDWARVVAAVRERAGPEQGTLDAVVRVEVTDRDVLHAAGASARTPKELNVVFVTAPIDYALSLAPELNQLTAGEEDNLLRATEVLNLECTNKGRIETRVWARLGREGQAPGPIWIESVQPKLTATLARDVLASCRDPGFPGSEVFVLETGILPDGVEPAALKGEDPPPATQRFRLVVDQSPPSVELSLGAEALVFHGSTEGDRVGLASLQPSFRIDEPLRAGTWTLRGPGGRESSGSLAGGARELELPEAPWNDAACPDGDWELALSEVRDRAGNAGTDSSWSWTVARSGPKLSGEPQDYVEKREDLDDLTVEVRAEDPNGLTELICYTVEVADLGSFSGLRDPVWNPEWVDADPAERAKLLPAGLRIMETTRRSDTRVDAKVTLPLDLSWSNHTLTVTYHAWDRQGNPSTKVQKYGLNQVVPPPVLGRVLVRHPDAGVEVNAMCGVTWQSPYTFRGGTEGDFRRKGYNLERKPWSWVLGPQFSGEGSCLTDFYMDEHEVSVAQYRAFLEHDDFGLPRHWPGGVVPGKDRRDELRRALAARAGDLPVVGVTWSEAAAYARFVGKMLPSYVWWEYAVRGGGAGRIWPGEGDQAQPEVFTTARACGTSGNRSLHGIWDLCGNGREWTSTAWQGSSFDGEGEGQAAFLRRDPLAGPALDLSRTKWHVVGVALDSAAESRMHYLWTSEVYGDKAKDDLGFRCALPRSVVDAALLLDDEAETNPELRVDLLRRVLNDETSR